MVNYIKLSDIKKISSDTYYQTFDVWTSNFKKLKNNELKNNSNKIKFKIINLISTYGNDNTKIYDLIYSMIIEDKLDSDSIYNIFCELVKYWYHEVLNELYNLHLPINTKDKDYTLLHLLSFPNTFPSNFIRKNDDLIKTYDFIINMNITPIDINKYNETCFHSLEYAHKNNKINDEYFEIIKKKMLYPNSTTNHIINVSLFKKIYENKIDDININDFILWSFIINAKLFMDDMHNFDKEIKLNNDYKLKPNLINIIYQILKNGPNKNINKKIPYINEIIIDMIKECKNNKLSPQIVILQKFNEYKFFLSQLII